MEQPNLSLNAESRSIAAVGAARDRHGGGPLAAWGTFGEGSTPGQGVPLVLAIIEVATAWCSDGSSREPCGKESAVSPRSFCRCSDS